MNLTDKEKHAFETYKAWKKENKDATVNSFFDTKRDFSVGTLWSARSKMGDHVPKTPGRPKKMVTEETKKKISLALKNKFAQKSAPPVMQTLSVPEPLPTERAIVIVCSFSSLREVLNGIS